MIHIIFSNLTCCVIEGEIFYIFYVVPLQFQNRSTEKKVELNLIHH